MPVSGGLSTYLEPSGWLIPGSLLRPWVGAIVDLRQLRSRQLRVALRGGEALMAEQLLNGAQVGPLFEQMRSEGVAQRVRMHVSTKAAQDGNALDDAANAPGCEARLSAGPGQAAQLQIDKQCRGSASLPIPCRDQESRTLGEIGADGPGGRVSQRNQALLLAFAAHQDGLVGPVNVFQIQAHQFSIADAASVEDFEDGLVARRPTGGVLIHRVHGLVHSFDGWYTGQMFGQARRCYEGGGILLDVAGPRQPLKPAANGGEGAGG